VGRGWILLSQSCDPGAKLDPELARFFAGIGGRSVRLSPEGPYRDVDGRYAAWFAEKGAAVVLQRPDFYVFGTARSEDGAGGLVATLRAMLEAH
jgi:hypothetical protein